MPAIRIRDANDAPLRGDGKYVVYWMIPARRLEHNFGLDLALQHCRNLKKPLVIFEALRCDYAWASDRIHGFVLDGMAENAATAQRHSILYHGYVEPWPGAGKGLLEAIAADACVVVTDEFPCFFLPHTVAAAAKKLPVRLQAVDSNGLLPLRTAEKEFPTAFSFRRFLQKSLPKHVTEFPEANPLAKAGFARHAQLAVRMRANARPALECRAGATRARNIHNYLHMMWGKKILEWSKSPGQALEIMIQLNNKYGLDGRDPNSYSGIFWVLGRYDRPWGPVRPVFGTIRYMSSQNTARKVSLKEYIRKYSPAGGAKADQPLLFRQ